jgi:hypothetical protein
MLTKRHLESLQRLLPLLPIALVLLVQAPREAAIFDDAFITFRYARNIALGRGFTYNPGPPVLGTTTPLFTAILAFIAALGDSASIPCVAFVISVAADCVSAWFIFRLARTAFDDDLTAILLAATWAVLPFRLSIAGGGMEASLFTLLLLVSFERLVIARAVVFGPLFAALAILTRPDAVIALAPIFAYLVLRDRPFAVKASALVVALIAPWVVWATSYFGSPIPNSLVAKTVAYRFFPGFAAYFILPFLGTWTIAQFTITPLLLSASFLGLGVIVIGLFHTARRLPSFIPLVVYGPLFLTIMAIANAPMFFPWYYYPILPSLLFAIASFAGFLPIPSWAARRGVLGLTLAATVVVPAFLIRFSPSWPLSREREQAYSDACAFLVTTAQSGDVLLAPDIGVLGWCLPDAEILDPVGLVSPGALAYLPRRPQGPAIPAELVFASEPDYIVALEQYVTPFLTPSPQFALDYRLAWSKPVTIAGRTQGLFVYSKAKDPRP